MTAGPEDAARRLVPALVFLLIFFAVAVPWTLWHRDRAAALVHGDAAGYWRSAVALARHNTFSETPYPNLVPVSHRTPGYPFVLSLVFRATGPSLPAAITLNVLLLAAQGLAVQALACRLGLGTGAALAAALLVALHPLALHWSQQVYTDTLFSTVLAGALALWFAGRTQPVATLLALLLAGLLPLVRPVGLYLLPLWAGLAVWRFRREAAPFLVIPAAVLLAGPTLAWMARNEARFGTFHFCEIGAWNLRFGHALAVQAEATGADYGALWAEGFKHNAPLLFRPVESPAIHAARWQREALAIFAAHPGVTARVTFRNFADLYGTSLGEVTAPFPPADVSPPPMTRYPGTLAFLLGGRFGAPPPQWQELASWQREAFLLGQIEHLVTAVVLLAAAAAVVLALPRARLGDASARAVLVLAGFWIAQTALSLPAGEFTAPRFRLPIHVVLMPLAIWGWAAFADRRRMSAAPVLLPPHP